MITEAHFKSICSQIELALNAGKRDFIIYPFGRNGMEVKDILGNRYGITERYIVDNHLCEFRSDIFSIDKLPSDALDCVLLLTVDNKNIYDDVLNAALAIFDEKQILKIFPNDNKTERKPDPREHALSFYRTLKTKIGKYSDGPLAGGDHPFIESIGAFCSFAIGVDVVANHPMQYLSTHGFLYEGIERPICKLCTPPRMYKDLAGLRGYFPGVEPHGELPKERRITIGNDVWLGRNVIIANYSNIGNGVIAGAGSIITRDVPDYAIVVGAPARIIRYRYTAKQISALNKIAWWDWSDEKIRANYDDFYLPIEEFIEKYGSNI